MSAIAVSLAVQGGGSHGAFSWGILDRLLEEVAGGRLTIRALSGASAGAFNAALAAYGLGLHPGNPAQGADAARRLLQAFWRDDAAMAPFSPYSATALAWRATTGSWNIDASPLAMSLDMASQVLSPYGAPRIDWLRLALGNKIDFAALQQQQGGPALYVSATNIRDNRRDIFARTAITYEVLAASASVPGLFQAALIDGTPYWDGGYMGNPALSPLLDHTEEAEDLIVLQVNPFRRNDMPPRTARAILDRLNEITFNTALVLELNTLQAVNQLLPPGGVGPKRPIRLHRIHDEAFMTGLGVASKGVILWPFLVDLFEAGRRAADDWLKDPAGGQQLGKSSTLGTGLADNIIGRKNIVR